MHFHIHLIGDFGQWLFDKFLQDMMQYDELLTRKYGEELTYDIHEYWEIDHPTEDLYRHIQAEALKTNEPYLIVIYQRSWVRYGGALGWADCNGSTATIYTLKWLPFWADTHNVRHELAHTDLCRQGKEWINAVHNDPEVR